MDSILRYLVQIGIPTFFLLSGMGLSFYKTENNTFNWHKPNVDEISSVVQLLQSLLI
jgi:hypothetical protein